MSVDLSVYVGERREGLVGSGRHVGSEVVQGVADGFANALGTHAGALKEAGYRDKDGEVLAELCAESKRLCEERPEVARGKSAARDALRREVKAGKQLRLDRRVSLEAVLDIDGDGLEAALVDRARRVLRETASSGDDAQTLGQQLVALATMYEAPALATLLDERGGAGGAAALRAQAKRLDEAAAGAQVGLGTREETEVLDLNDGLMLERMRAIRKIARRAAVRRGEPALAEAFSLAGLG